MATQRARRGVANTVGERRCSGYSEWANAEDAFPPGPGDEWGDVNPAYYPAVEPSVRRVVDGVAQGLARDAQLKILGNGVVPQQAALAWRLLT